MTDAPKALLTRAVPFEARADDTGDGFTLEGYAAVFNSPTRIDSWEGIFDEQIARGSFTKTLQERTPIMQFDHGHDIATGSVPIAAIEDIGEDRRGLFVRAKMFDNPRVEPIRQAIAGGAITGMSFKFRVTREDWDDQDSGVELRTIREVELFEAGPVAMAAYEATSVGVRSLLADLSPEQRIRLLDDLQSLSDAAQRGTSDSNPDAAQEGTSGSQKVRDPRAIQTLAAAHRGRRPNPRKDS